MHLAFLLSLYCVLIILRIEDDPFASANGIGIVAIISKSLCNSENTNSKLLSAINFNTFIVHDTLRNQFA